MKKRIEELALKTAKLTGGGVVADAKFISQAITTAVNEAIELAAKDCEQSDKSTHPSDLADAIRKLKEQS